MPQTKKCFSKVFLKILQKEIIIDSIQEKGITEKLVDRSNLLKNANSERHTDKRRIS